MKNKLWTWQYGRQNTGYQILTLVRWFNKLLPIDCYLIKYPPGSYIPPHRDELKAGKHFRVNFVLTHPEGGEFICEDCIVNSRWVNIFRPDLNTHEVTKVTGNRARWVFSIGWNWRH